MPAANAEFSFYIFHFFSSQPKDQLSGPCHLGRSRLFFGGPSFFLLASEEDCGASLPVAASCYCVPPDCFLRDVRGGVRASRVNWPTTARRPQAAEDRGLTETGELLFVPIAVCSAANTAVVSVRLS